MKCRLEENSRQFDVLCALRKGYRTGDFGKLFPYLAQDCVMESQWVLTPNTGYDAVASYFIEKGKTLAENDCFPNCSIVELTGNCSPVKNSAVSVNDEEPKTSSVGLIYKPGKLCMLIEQRINDETKDVLVDFSIDDAGMVKRIDLCMPELFKYRYFCEYVCFFPTTAEWEEGEEYHSDQEHLVRVSEYYYGELYLFLACAGEQFDEYEDLRIPMNHWCHALGYWKDFMRAVDFDEAFEKIAGVDYDSGTVQNPDAAKRLGRIGKEMWENRHVNEIMLDDLIEWTNLYKSTHAFVNTYGW